MRIQEFIQEYDIELSSDLGGEFEKDAEEIIGQNYCDLCPRNKKSVKLYIFKSENGSENIMILCIKHLQQFYKKVGKFIKEEKEKHRDPNPIETKENKRIEVKVKYKIVNKIEPMPIGE